VGREEEEGEVMDMSGTRRGGMMEMIECEERRRRVG
jgi:hypothetical protein